MLESSTKQNFAPLANVALIYKALGRAMERPHHLPGLVCAYGPSGYGKTFAATYTANKHRAYYVECRSSWTRKSFLLGILDGMGIKPTRTIPQIADQVAEELTLSRRPLIVDEADHLVDRGAVELIRDLYEASKTAILIIGEEMLANKLSKYERVHGRVLEWVPAQPVSLMDAKHLATLYAKDLTIADDLLQQIVKLAKGSVRRVVVNIDLIRREAQSKGIATIDLAAWSNKEFYTGEARRRSA